MIETNCGEERKLWYKGDRTELQKSPGNAFRENTEKMGKALSKQLAPTFPCECHSAQPSPWQCTQYAQTPWNDTGGGDDQAKVRVQHTTMKRKHPRGHKWQRNLSIGLVDGGKFGVEHRSELVIREHREGHQQGCQDDLQKHIILKDHTKLGLISKNIIWELSISGHCKDKMVLPPCAPGTSLWRKRQKKTLKTGDWQGKWNVKTGEILNWKRPRDI